MTSLSRTLGRLSLLIATSACDDNAGQMGAVSDAAVSDSASADVSLPDGSTVSGSDAPAPDTQISSAPDATPGACIAVNVPSNAHPASRWFDLEILADGFQAHEGTRVRALVDISSAAVAVAETTVQLGAFTFFLPGGVTDYASIAVYVDRDRNLACTAGEPAWSRNAGVIAVNTGLDVAKNRVVARIRLPVDDCNVCLYWQTHPLNLGANHPYCQTGTGYDLAMPVACPP